MPRILARIKRWRPHAFFGLYVAVCAIGVAAGLTAPADDAAWALGSTFVHRCEVGLAVGGLAYLIGAAGWLAWHGHYFPQLNLPGGFGGGGEPQPVDPAAGP